MNAEGIYKDFPFRGQRGCERIRDIFKVEDEGSSLEGDGFIHSIRGGQLLRNELKRNGTRSIKKSGEVFCGSWGVDLDKYFSVVVTKWFVVVMMMYTLSYNFFC